VNPVTLRTYHFGYGDDADIGLPRLTSVVMSGQAETDAAEEYLPVASYEYGRATQPNGMVYQKTYVDRPQVIHDAPLSFVRKSDSEVLVLESAFQDVTGDGRADIVFRHNDAMMMFRQRSDGEGG